MINLLLKGVNMEYQDIKSPIDLYNFMEENIIYGFVSRYDNTCYTRVSLKNDTLYENLLKRSYFLQKPFEILQNKYGLCWDQVELERDWFLKNKYKIYTFYVKLNNHCFLIFESNHKFYLFERSFKLALGIHQFSTLDEALLFYCQLESFNRKVSLDKIDIWQYDDVVFGVSFSEFCTHIINEGRKLQLTKKY